ncbi:hypothetical protein ABMY26_36565 (plasmid) [Azospirillum sp. HJ39]|uniref:hypothetical protein n=1 Tax=Azospirillum sp. HJ39 TaxID=3159496 RepID=UPI003556E24E
MSTAPIYARGVVTVIINGDPVELRCTPRAAAAISKATGGIQNALNSLISIDYAVLLVTFSAASGKTGEAVEQALFDYGITPMARVLYQFTLMLLNGGRTEEERRADAQAAAQGNGEAPATTASEAAAS